MFKDQCISVTDLRTNTKKCLENIEKNPKYVFLNNHPIAVLISISGYEEHFLAPQLIEMSAGEAGPSTIAQAKKAKKTRKRDLMNLHE